MKNTRTFDQLLDEKYGKAGSPARDKFDSDSIAVRMGIMLKEDSIKSNLSKKAPATKTNKKV